MTDVKEEERGIPETGVEIEIEKDMIRKEKKGKERNTRESEGEDVRGRLRQSITTATIGNQS